MKILYLVAEFPYPVTGGHRVQTDNLLKYMSRNHDCDVLGFCNNADLSQTIEEAHSRLPRLHILGLFPCRSGLPLQFARLLALIRLTPVFLARFQNDDLNQAVDQAVRDTCYDVIHLEGVAVAPFIDKCRSRPTVLSTVDAVSLAYRRLTDADAGMGAARRILRKFGAWSTSSFERRVLPMATKVHVFHQPDCQYLRSYSPPVDVQQIEMSLPEAVTNYPIPESEGDGPPYILFWGTLNVACVASGLMRFLSDAYPRIQRECPHVQLLVLGQGASAPLRNLMSNTRDLKYIEWVEDYCKVVVGAHAVIFPEFPVTALKTRAIQAMALGRPVVAWPQIFQGTSMEDGVHCFQRELDRGFTETVISLLKDTTLRKTMGENARRLVLDEYSFEGTGLKWQNLYDEAIAKFQKNEPKKHE